MRSGANATGPRSVEGKSRSRNNSFKQGLTGATALLPSDDRDAYEQYIDGILDSLHPGSLLEHEICRDVADAHWNLRRIRSDLAEYQKSPPDASFDLCPAPHFRPHATPVFPPPVLSRAAQAALILSLSPRPK